MVEKLTFIADPGYRVSAAGRSVGYHCRLRLNQAAAVRKLQNGRFDNAFTTAWKARIER